MMTAGKWKDAKAAFQQALEQRPNSGFALYGIGQATEKTGELGATTVAYQQFLKAWKTADPGLPETQHAEQWISQHAAVASSTDSHQP
jgi:tetratricopeptide (TPR) repeat protein